MGHARRRKRRISQLSTLNPQLFCRARFRFVAADAGEAALERGGDDQLGDARFQPMRAIPQDEQIDDVGAEQPEVGVRGEGAAVDERGDDDDVREEGGDDHARGEADAGEALRAAVVFGDGAEGDGPPEVAVDLHVPVFPAGVGWYRKTFDDAGGYRQVKNRR